MQQARVGHQNGALLFLSSSGQRQPGWFSSPAAKGRSWVTLVRVVGPGPGHTPPSPTLAHLRRNPAPPCAHGRGSPARSEDT